MKKFNIQIINLIQSDIDPDYHDHRQIVNFTLEGNSAKEIKEKLLQNLID